jgi:hypothetical protein
MGEWIELWNVSNDWLDLRNHRLADYGVDDTEIESIYSDSLIIPPEGYALLCASEELWDNGGVDCHGTFEYDTFGGGFSLSNTSDEVRLLRPTGSTIDSFSYGSGFAIEGKSMGVDPDDASLTGNNLESNWCDQWGFLLLGDEGNPGEQNDSCF